MFKNNWLHLFALTVFYFVFTFAYENSLVTDSMIFRSLSGEYSAEVITQYIQAQHKWRWLSYLLIPVVLLVRTSLIAFLIQIADYFIEDKDYPFADFWRVTLNAEWCMVAMVMIKFFWFVFVQTDFTLQEINDFAPLTLYSLIRNKDMLDLWMSYPLKILNIFEIVYWIILIYGVKNIIKQSFGKSFEIVLLSYGLGLLVWIAVIMYLILNLT